jgi:putative aldouronate transport system permease protein
LDTKIRNRVFDWIIIIVICVSLFVCIIPFLYIVAMSLSSNSAIISQKVGLFPVGFTLETYKTVLSDKDMIYTLFYTIALTIGSTAISMFLTICAAYPLTKKRLKGRNVLLLLCVITMYFTGGMIPDYILVKNLHMTDKIWSLLLPSALSVYNMIILKTFFSSLPESMEESASIEGANELTILMKIILPLSMPALATLSLFYAVGRWNGFQDALIYITDKKLFPMQLKLYQIISVNQQLDIQQEGGIGAHIAPESLKAATVIFATVPILLVYPKLQKYFVSGVMIGAVKG